ncbi:cytochrome c biogenesis protein CcdA [Paracoccus sediminis]|uniref:Cytochrome c biogenesis protein CcdA n=1 Tax=Paracoccus sediminis TaxID=1214787 RepID=A0A238UVF1_9RHOB|nr:cytochrome c biogenesis protein CcdA [Paracoccus sediminis]TBN52769.1 cytochrome c biogenesis protein CcdA [Paracoccus sediminis]SNR25988.1 cytochrome c-type biogenesis protein [Paracoccus sediminis]
MPEISFGGAALAGLLSFLSPCILPMVPFYLCYLAGISIGELRESRRMDPRARRRLVMGAIAFSLGVTTIFVMLGLGATAMGSAFSRWRAELSWVAAAVLALFGLHFLGVIRIPFLYRQARIESTGDPATLAGAYTMGLAFGFGWTPCAGPALAAILFMASAQDSLALGAALLLVYGLAMTFPFILISFFARPFMDWAARHQRMLGMVERVMGVMLILFAALIATDGVNRIAAVMVGAMDWSATTR